MTIEIDNCCTKDQSISNIIMRIVGDHLGIPSAVLKVETKIADDLGADSLDYQELIMTIEERFGITIPKDDIKHIQRIDDIILCVNKILPKNEGITNYFKEGG